MSSDEQNLQTSSSQSVNKSKIVLRHSNRVSFSETANKSLAPENEYETPSSSSAAALARTTSSSSTSATTTTTSSLSLKRNTPILFSTNRGLHLRMTSLGGNSNSNTSTTSNNNNNLMSTKSSVAETGSGGGSMNRSRTTTAPPSTNTSYAIAFCDLERWSTNRANTVSLEDTFTIARPAVVPHSAASGSLASTSLRFLPQKTNSIRFKGYSRFDVE